MSYGQVSAGYAVESDEAKMAMPSKKIKRPGFLKRWIVNAAKEAISQDQLNANMLIATTRDIAPIGSRRELQAQPLHLKIYSANGGTIIETSKYDRQKDRENNQLHIITHDQNLGEGLAKIITMEALRG